MNLQNDLILKTLRGEPTDRTPVWMMRQAGRYLPEYMAIREKYGFFERCKTPELACEITIQPVDIIGVDAAILFSDILVVPQAMGLATPVKVMFDSPCVLTKNDFGRLRKGFAASSFKRLSHKTKEWQPQSPTKSILGSAPI